jgi:hypothetical protein
VTTTAVPVPVPVAGMGTAVTDISVTVAVETIMYYTVCVYLYSHAIMYLSCLSTYGMVWITNDFDNINGL